MKDHHMEVQMKIRFVNAVLMFVLVLPFSAQAQQLIGGWDYGHMAGLCESLKEKPGCKDLVGEMQSANTALARVFNDKENKKWVFEIMEAQNHLWKLQLRMQREYPNVWRHRHMR